MNIQSHLTICGQETKTEDMLTSRSLETTKNFILPLLKTYYYRKISPYRLLPGLWISLTDEDIKKTKSKASFNIILKRFFLNKLSADYTCNTVDCCVPTATLVHNLISPAS